MGELVDALVRRLPAGSLRLGARVRGVERHTEGFTVGIDGAASLAVDAVVVATPAPVASALLAGFDPALAEELAGTGYASCVTVNLAWSNAAVRRPSRLHGFFVPRTAGLPLVAAGFVQAKFPARVPGGLCVVRAFCGGALQPAVAELPEAELIAQVTAAVAPLLGAEGAPAWTRVFRHTQAMPQVGVGHLDRVERLLRRAQAHPGLALAGAPLGAYGVPDVVAAADTAAAKAFARLATSS